MTCRHAKPEEMRNMGLNFVVLMAIRPSPNGTQRCCSVLPERPSLLHSAALALQVAVITDNGDSGDPWVLGMFHWMEAVHIVLQNHEACMLPLLGVGHSD